MVIDTKYMATHNSALNSRQSSSLQDLHRDLKSQLTPQLHLPDHFKSYQTNHAPHEAGYDSYLTAQVFVKLATKLDAGLPIRSPHIDATQAENLFEPIAEFDDPISSDDDGGVTLNSPPNAMPLMNPTQPLAIPVLVKVDGQASLLDSEIVDDMTGSPPLSRQLSPSKFLTDTRGGNDFLPPPTSTFWKVYANKLRVYGTQIEVCDLDSDFAGVKHGEENLS